MHKNKDKSSLPKNILLNNTYKIKQIISTSELSIVYKVYHPKSKETQIVKEYFPKALALRDIDNKTVLCRLPSTQAKYMELKEAFLHEALLIKELNHPHIVRYLDHFEENGTVYLVMEHCRGKTLDKYIQENLQMNKDFFKVTLLPLLEVLEYIHDQGILHLDIKPANILISKDGQPKLLDFGSAIYYEQQSQHKIFTTSGFSPLELYSDKSKQGTYSDIYSLAATLYYYFTGRVPVDVSQRLIEDRLENIRKYNRGINPLLSSVIMRGLAVHYQKRCSSLRSFKRAIYLEYLLLTAKKALSSFR